MNYSEKIRRNECFPICHLNGQVRYILANLNSIRIKELVEKGLNKKIRFKDLNGPISDIACLDMSNQIHLSAAYCQFLWSLSYVALRMYDGLIVQNEIENLNNAEKAQYFKELEDYSGIELVQELIQYTNWDKICESCYKVFNTGNELMKNRIENYEKFYNVPNALNANQSKVNGIYCYAVIFILNHEISHFSLNHDIDLTKSDEESADSSAFWTLYFDTDEKEKKSAMIGTLTALCSLMFFNRQLNGDDQHPDEDKRVLTALSVIKEEYSHYLPFVVKLFELWSFYFEFEDSFKSLKSDSSSNEEYFEKILTFIGNLKSKMEL